MKLILSSDQNKFLQASVQLDKLASSERLKISLKKFALFFLIAMVSILIPVFHFVLVPLFLILSIIFAVKAYSTQYILKIQGACHCVECQQPMKTEFFLDDNLRLGCDKCFAKYLVEK